MNPDDLIGRDFDVLEELLVKAFCEGWRVQEIPFEYKPRLHRSSSARVGRLGYAYIRAFWRLWTLRNSIAAADYDDRAYDSVIPLQRYWQRRRFGILGGPPLARAPSRRGLWVQPDTSGIDGGNVGVDVLARKLRYDRKFRVPLVQASGFDLPFPDDSFCCVVSSQVIEHVPKDSPMIDKLCRVLGPGGRLVLGTPDYSRWEWVYLEKLYGKVAPGATGTRTSPITREMS